MSLIHSLDFLVKLMKKTLLHFNYTLTAATMLKLVSNKSGF